MRTVDKKELHATDRILAVAAWGTAALVFCDLH
jgi:hypothetical protein